MSALERATDPTTTPATLTRLAAHEDPEVRAKVAANPNSPRKALLSLLAENTGVVLANPALQIMLIERPRLFARAPHEQRLRWASTQGLPGWLLAQLASASEQDVLDALGENPSTPVEVLEALAFPDELSPRGDDEWVDPVTTMLGNPSTPEGLAFDVARQAFEQIDDDYGALPPEIEAMVGELLDEACDPIPEGLDVLDAFSVDGDEPVPLLRVEGVFVHATQVDGAFWGFDSDDEPSPPPAFWSNEDVRSTWGMTPDELAANGATPSCLLERLAHHHAASVRAAAAQHESMPEHELARLARDESPLVRLSVAQNIHTPPEALSPLSRDQSGSVRRAAAANPSTPDEALSSLASDRLPSVRQTARARLRAA